MAARSSWSRAWSGCVNAAVAATVCTRPVAHESRKPALARRPRLIMPRSTVMLTPMPMLTWRLSNRRRAATTDQEPAKASATGNMKRPQAPYRRKQYLPPARNVPPPTPPLGETTFIGLALQPGRYVLRRRGECWVQRVISQVSEQSAGLNSAATLRGESLRQTPLARREDHVASSVAQSHHRCACVRGAGRQPWSSASHPFVGGWGGRVCVVVVVGGVGWGGERWGGGGKGLLTTPPAMPGSGKVFGDRRYARFAAAMPQRRHRLGH